MNQFLHQVADSCYQRYGQTLSQYAFVLPNRRSGLFFQQELGRVIDKPIFSPTIYTIDELFVSLSSLETADRVTMLFLLYDHYQRLTHTTEPFDSFIFFGDMLLGDFDDVDKYMVDAKLLFSNMYDLKQMEAGFEWMSQEQREAIQLFWGHFDESSIKDSNKDSFLQTWAVMYDLYLNFRNELIGRAIGYQGMIFREVAEQFQQHPTAPLTHQGYIFVGLNALSVAEQRLLSILQRAGKAEFFWDYAPEWVRDPDNKASMFVQRNLKLFPPAVILEPSTIISESQMMVYSVPSAIGQTQVVERILTDNPDLKAGNTAIILPDEKLLLPLLHALPHSVGTINVTMGYPLYQTQVAGWLDRIFGLQAQPSHATRRSYYSHTAVLPLLSDRYATLLSPASSLQLSEEILKSNQIFIPVTRFASLSPEKDGYLRMLFTPCDSGISFLNYLLALLMHVRGCFCQSAEEAPITPDRITTDELELEYIYAYHKQIQQLRTLLIDNRQQDLDIATTQLLLKRLIATLTLPFEGEPLTGFQVMGVLETRVLDFENVIILSMNEGLFPAGRITNTYIPHNLRRGFALPTNEHQDALFAYHFYRLIARSQKVYMIYDSRSEGLRNGERSRFIHQLYYHYSHPISFRNVGYSIAADLDSPISVVKTPIVMERINQFLDPDSPKSFSASSINTYIDCPLRWYLAYVEGWSEQQELTEEIEPNTFGQLFHATMEYLYNHITHSSSALITPEVLLQLIANHALIDQAILQSFAEHYFHSEQIRALSGRNIIIARIIHKYVIGVLKVDLKLAPFSYIASENRIDSIIQISGDKHVRLKGFIDRVDRVGSSVRLLDYKSGRSQNEFKELADLFDPTLKTGRPRVVLQLMLYGLMYRDHHHLPISPVVYSLRDIFSDSFEPHIIDKQSGEVVADFEPYRAEFTQHLSDCLSTIFDPTIPILPTQDDSLCSYCPYNGLCNR